MTRRTMSIVHTVVIAGGFFGDVAIWFLLRGMPDISTAQLILYTLLPGAALALALYCVCFVFNCMGR